MASQKHAYRHTHTSEYVRALEEANKRWKVLVNSGVKPSEAHKRAGISKLLADK